MKTGEMNFNNTLVVSAEPSLKSSVNLNNRQIKAEVNMSDVDCVLPKDNSNNCLTTPHFKCSSFNNLNSNNMIVDSKLGIRPLLCSSGSTIIIPSSIPEQTSNLNTIKLSTSKVDNKIVLLPSSVLPVLSLSGHSLKKDSRKHLLSSLATKAQGPKTDKLNNAVFIFKDGKYYPVQQQKLSNIVKPSAVVVNDSSTNNIITLNPKNANILNSSAKISVLNNVLSSNSYSILKSASQQAPVKIVNSSVGSLVKNINLQSQSDSSRPGLISTLNIMKPGHSLLKKNLETVQINSFVSNLVPVAKSEPNGENIVCDELSVFPKKKKTVSNNCTPVIPKHIIHQERLRYAIGACKFTEQSKCLRWFLRHLPLICGKVSDPDFKEIHPYAAPSHEVYFSWNIGRQRASEWLRAKAVQNMLLKVGFTEQNVWSTLSIVKYARLHGYTPVIPGADAYPESCNRNVSAEPKSTYSEPVRIMDWLESSNYSGRNLNGDVDIEVDVENLDTPPIGVVVKEEKTVHENQKLDVMEVDSELESSCEFVHETVRKIGIHLKAEEIIPGILYRTTERLMFEAVKSLVDDVLRRSLFCAYRRNSFSLPDVITPYDIQQALCERPEFDILTNSGLGVQNADIG